MNNLSIMSYVNPKANITNLIKLFGLIFRWSHWMMSYGCAILRDWESLGPLYKKINVLPLGSGALAGTPFDIDRKFIAAELGFTDVSLNSLDATGNRDFIGKLSCQSNWLEKASCKIK